MRRRRETDEDRLWRTGLPAFAVVVAFAYLGQTRREQTRIELHLDVTTADGTSRVVHHEYMPLGLVDRLRVGSRVGIRVDPVDVSRLVIDWSTL